MEDYDEEALLTLLTKIEQNLPPRSPPPSSAIISSSTEILISSLSIFLNLCLRGQIRDIEWTSVEQQILFYTKLFHLLQYALRKDELGIISSTISRPIFEIINSIFSIPEFYEENIVNTADKYNTVISPSLSIESDNSNDNTTNISVHNILSSFIDNTFMDTILRYLVTRSSTNIENESIRKDTLGLVTWVSSNNSTIEGGGARSVGLITSSYIKNHDKNDENNSHNENSTTPNGSTFYKNSKLSSTTPSRSYIKFDELIFLRSLLYWLYAQFPAKREIILDRCETYLRAFSRDPTVEAATATNIVLLFYLKILEGEKSLLIKYRIPFGMEMIIASKQNSSPSESPVETTNPILTNGRYLIDINTISPFVTILISLHSLPGMLSDISANLSIYHEALTKLICLIITVYPSLLESIIERLLRIWREDCRARGNTAKGILIFHEIFVIIGDCGINDIFDNMGDTSSNNHAHEHHVHHSHHPFTNALGLVLYAIEESIISDNSREAQIALNFFKHPAIVYTALSSKRLPNILKILLRGNTNAALMHNNSTGISASPLNNNNTLHWNATVNKMTASAIRSLLTANKDQVLEKYDYILNNPHFNGEGSQRSLNISEASSSTSSVILGSMKSVSSNPTVKKLQTDNVNYRDGKNGQPPVTITGVAPWANKSSIGTNRSQPPSTVTGVAPWAIKTTENTPLSNVPIAPRNHSLLPPGSKLIPPPIQTDNINKAAIIEESPSSSISSPSPLAVSTFTEGNIIDKTRKYQELYTSLEKYLEKLSPSEDLSSYNAHIYTCPTALLSQPVLLPTLAFHDLVFGKVLGEGSFSTVTYARQILKGKPTATWPEYAVKAISTTTLHELGYENAVRREMAILSTLTHPSVCRLISAFRWRAGAFLVLEYASGGDLQNTLAKIGSLDASSCKLLFAEIGYALYYIHQKGFVYGDCKPENIVLVTCPDNSVHAKLTDFAACRPISEEGKTLIKDSQHILRNLRNGDWRVTRGLQTAIEINNDHHTTVNTNNLDGDGIDILDNSTTANNETAALADNALEEDNRIEGTEAYLSPELASRQYSICQPTISSDAYAFGITLFQCLAGYLPDTEAIWQEYQQLKTTEQFNNSSETITNTSTNNNTTKQVKFSTNKKFRSPFPKDFPVEAKELIYQLLHPDPTLRLGSSSNGFLDILQHSWFQSVLNTQKDTNIHNCILNLYSKPGALLAQGTNGPPPDPAWSRRHNSSIWAPLPQYTTSNKKSSSSSLPLSNENQLSNVPSDIKINNNENIFTLSQQLTLSDIMRLESTVLPGLPPVGLS